MKRRRDGFISIYIFNLLRRFLSEANARHSQEGPRQALNVFSSLYHFLLKYKKRENWRTAQRTRSHYVRFVWIENICSIIQSDEKFYTNFIRKQKIKMLS